MNKTILAACSAILLTGFSAQAEMTLDASGTATGTSQNSFTVLGENHIIVKANSTYEKLMMKDASHPYNGMSGECFGSFEMKIPSAAGSGSCIFSDDEGNVSASRFEVTGMTAEGAITGTWSLLGGTGKFEGATGGGRFHNMSDREAGTFENTIAGAMNMQ